MERLRRSYLAALSTAGVGLAGCLGGQDETKQTGGPDDAGDWLTTSLTTVLTDETFTLDGFDTPTLMQTFAVWCGNCSRQEAQLDKLRQQVDDVTLVNINIGDDENAEKVRKHAKSNGYDWHWAVPLAEFIEALIEEFDTSITVAPKTPVVLICPDGSYRRLENGVKSADKLQSELDAGC
jgi:thiol-disulfide isomerase/thioredoxin